MHTFGVIKMSTNCHERDFHIQILLNKIILKFRGSVILSLRGISGPEFYATAFEEFEPENFPVKLMPVIIPCTLPTKLIAAKFSCL